MHTASRLRLWLGAAVIIGAAAVATTSVPRRTEVPVVPSPVVQAAAPVPAVPAVPVAIAAARTRSKHAPARVAVSAPAAPAFTPADPAYSAGMRVYLDPETGLIGSMPADAAAEPELNTEGAGLTPVVQADGSLMVDLEGRFEMYSTVTLGSDKRPVFQCSQKAHPAHDSCMHPAQPAEE